MDTMLPWPSRGARRAAIASARAERQQARAEREAAEAGAAHAEQVKAEIERLAARNHFAASIAEQIALRHARRGGM